MNSYSFGAEDEYRVLLATDRAARERALSLVYGVYLATGLTEPRESRMQLTIHDALPNTTSFLVERFRATDTSASAVASLTLIPDGELGLPLDVTARDALDALRSAGHKLVELAKLATVGATEKKGGNRRAPREEIILHLFKLAYLTALKAEGATDFVISVSKHQARFFRRVFFFEVLDGPAGDADDDGLTVPLIMDLTTAEEKHRRRAEARPGEQHLYEFFVNDREPDILAWLARHRAPLSTEDAHYLFAERSKLLQKVDEAARRLILKSYPGLEL